MYCRFAEHSPKINILSFKLLPDKAIRDSKAILVTTIRYIF